MPLMSKASQRSNASSERSFTSRLSAARNERTYSMIAEQVNPFIHSVQCTVSARAHYPTRHDLVSINSFVDYDNNYSTAKRNASLDKLHLQFRQGDGICVLGQFNGMLVGYLEKDPSRKVGFFAPRLVYVDLGSINQIEPPSSLINAPASAYNRRILTSVPAS